jgi:hypothetical protein
MKSRRMISVGAFLLCSMIATSVMARELASPTETQMGFFLATPEGKVQTISLESFLASIGQGVACNGGSVYCTSIGPTLTCPSSGGPTCTASQICTCLCKTLLGNQLVAYNACLDSN